MHYSNMKKKINPLFDNREIHDVKYIRELHEYWNAYMFSVINEIYVGVGIGLGLSEDQAYNLIQKNPYTLTKATFFKNIFYKFRKIFSYKTTKFRPDKKTFGTGKKPMNENQWRIFYETLDRYWKEHVEPVTEDVVIKGHILGKETTQFRKKKKPYKNQSLYQIDFDQYNGDMPKRIDEAYRKYDFSNSEKKILNQSFSSVAMNVQNINNEIKEAIRTQVVNGISNGKSHSMIASDLYWYVQKDEKLNNKYSAESLRRNWNRISQTEMASVYEAGILAPYESQAMESLRDIGKACYFVFSGGTCPWCRAHQGTLVRMIPSSIVIDPSDDSLKSMGIHDPNTDIAVWIGKNNVGFRENKSVHGWRICTPAHPYNVATLKPISIEDEFYNEKTGEVEKRQEKQKHIPQSIDYSYQSKEEKDYRKPTFIDTDIVRYNNNIYERVRPDEYKKRKAEWDKNNSLPIPVSMDSTRYDKIFGSAERNQ